MFPRLAHASWGIRVDWAGATRPEPTVSELTPILAEGAGRAAKGPEGIHDGAAIDFEPSSDPGADLANVARIAAPKQDGDDAPHEVHGVGLSIQSRTVPAHLAAGAQDAVDHTCNILAATKGAGGPLTVACNIQKRHLVEVRRLLDCCLRETFVYYR